jgi:hypothetical protein
VKHLNRYIILIAAFFILVVIIQMGAPRRVSWEPSFVRQEKIPYGAYILFDILPKLFPNEEITFADESPYLLVSGYQEGITYFFLNDDLDIDDESGRALLSFVAAGNTVFAASESFSGVLADSLHLRMGGEFDPLGDSTTINLVNPALKAPRNYIYKNHTVDAFFSRFDTTATAVLGVNNMKHPNYIRVRYGEGDFYLSAVPYAFTNYNMLERNNAEYVARALSYLPKQKVMWDEYYKAGRKKMESPLRYLLSQESLRWAYYVALVGVLLFVIFMGRRRQRIIPEIKPLPNTTLDFVSTVGQLYYQHGNHKNIAEKKITYFLDQLRSTFGVNTQERGDDFYRAVAARSGTDPADVRSIFEYIDMVQRKERIEESELLALSGAIERFEEKKSR